MLLPKNEREWVEEYGVNLQHVFPLQENRDLAPFGSAWAKISPGETSTAHSHRVAEVLFFTKGSGIVNMDSGDRYDVSEGDVVYAEPNSEHSIHNPIDNQEDLILVSVWWEPNQRLIKHLNMHLLPVTE